jgi:hypothetical protein
MRPLRNPLRVEQLDDRLTPAVNATELFGVLIVTGSATDPGDTIRVVQTAEDTFDVFDGDTKVNDEPLEAGNVVLALGRASDTVEVDLGGFSASTGLAAYLGGGDDTLTVTNGELRAVLVSAGAGDDTVTFEESAVLSGPAVVSLDSGNDTFELLTTNYDRVLVSGGFGTDSYVGPDFTDPDNRVVAFGFESKTFIP